MIEVKEIQLTDHENGWKKQPLRQSESGEVFSADDVINAYFMGKKDQRSQEDQLKFEKLETNLKRAASISENIFSFIKESGFKCDGVYLKIKNIYSFTSFFLINEDDYCSDNFLKVYEETITVKKEVNTSNIFDYTTILTPSNEFFDKHSLVSDGYILSYGGVQ